VLLCIDVQGVKGSIGSFINLIMELKKCCNHAFLVRLPDTSDDAAVEVDRFEVMLTENIHFLSNDFYCLDLFIFTGISGDFDY